MPAPTQTYVSLTAPSDSAAREKPRAPVACRLHARGRLLRGAETELLGLVLQDESDLQEDPIFCDLPLLDNDLLTLDPRTTEVAKGLLGSGNPLLNRVFEALGGRGLDFGDFGDGHRRTPGQRSWRPMGSIEATVGLQVGRAIDARLPCVAKMGS